MGAVAPKKDKKSVLIGDTKTNNSEISVLNLIVIYSRMQLLWFPNILNFL
jgi:hypothetical protein